MTKNMGNADRAIRAILGVALLAAFFTMELAWGWVLLVLAVVLLATAAMGWCPPYALLGIKTCKTQN